MQRTKISYLTHTWNPITGCSPASPGCKGCWAAGVSHRYGWPWGAPVFHPERIMEVTPRQRPARIGVTFMSDLYHPGVDPKKRYQIFRRIEYCPQHTFVILTKRPENISTWQIEQYKNVWLGVSVENDATLWRADYIRKIDVPVRFISFEPLIGGVPLPINLDGINWVIVGGESGSGFRPMNLRWATLIKEICRIEKVPFYFKQVSALHPTDAMIPEDLRVREYPHA